MVFVVVRFVYKMFDVLNGVDNKVECVYVRLIEIFVVYFVMLLLSGVSIW